MTVKRYDPEGGFESPPVFPGGMEPCTNGGYVKHSDYVKLEQAIKRIEEERLNCLRKRSLEADGNLFDAIADAAKMVGEI